MKTSKKICTIFVTAFALMFASQAVAYTLLSDDYTLGSGTVQHARQNPLNALHESGDNDDTAATIGVSDFTTLGFGGSIVLYLANNEAIKNTSGFDLTVFETTGGANDAGNELNYPEYAKVYAFTGVVYDAGADYSSDSYWTLLGTALQNESFELGSLAFTTAIKIVDATPLGGVSTDGYDVYGMGVNQTTPVPVPAAVWMLGTGLVALLGMRRKMTA